MEKCKPEDKIIKFEGKIAINNITYKKEETKETLNPSIFEEIESIKKAKGPLHDFITKGILVKGLNPKGKTKEFILSFSPDLMKIYFHKPKVPLIPPKAKYTLETPLSQVVKGYGTDLFKKTGGVFSKPPDKSLCFSVIQEKLDEEMKEKSLNIICTNEKECNKIFSAFEIGIRIAKSKCGKENRENLYERNSYLESL